jgi:solute carrier family 15 (peptide/histidine transporter), member 3/4
MNNDSWNDSDSDVKFKQQQQQPLFRPRTRSMTPNRILTQQLQLSMAINDSRNKRTQNCSLVILLIVNLLERFAYYGLICNYVLYLNKQPLFWESYNASTILLIFLGITYVSSLIGGWVADSLMGKFYTIILSYFIYIIGYAAFPLIAYNKNSIPNYCNSNRSIVDWIIINDEFNQTHLTKIKDFDRSIADESCSWIIILTVILIGVAVGFIKANLGPFGADQVMSRGQTMIFKYFNWLYWCINLGSLISFSFLAYFQQNYSFFIGFTIPFCVLVLSFVLFLCGSGCYVKQAAEVSILSNIFRVLLEAFRSAKRRKNLIRQQQRERAYILK